MPFCAMMALFSDIRMRELGVYKVKRSVALLCFLLAPSVAMPAPPAPTQVGVPIVNDGYLVLSQARPIGPQVMVCPPGKLWLKAAGWGNREKTCSEDDGGEAKKGTAVSSVTPQAALDLAFGKNVAVAVGVAPVFAMRTSTVIYYRLTKKSERGE